MTLHRPQRIKSICALKVEKKKKMHELSHYHKIPSAAAVVHNVSDNKLRDFARTQTTAAPPRGGCLAAPRSEEHSVSFGEK